MQARLIRELSELEKLEGPWNDLIAHSDFREPCYSWTWQMLWWKHFGSEDEPFVVAVENEDRELCAVAFLMRKITSLRGLSVRTVSFAANAITPRSTILYRRDRSLIEGVDAVLRCLANHRNEWDWANLVNIDAGLPYLGSLHDLGRQHRIRVLTSAGRRSPQIKIGDNFEEYLLKVLNRERRHSIRRKVRVLSRQNYRVTEFSRPEEMDQAIKAAMAVSKASWKGSRGSDISSSGARRGFYTEVAKDFARRGQLRIWLSYLDDTPIALEYYLASGRKLHFLVNDFDETFEKSSPGTVLLYQVLEQLHKEQVEEFDFGGEAYAYKMKWATGIREHVTIELFNCNWYSSFIFITKARILPLLRAMRGMCGRIWGRAGQESPTETTLRPANTKMM
ncbi:MAG: GNAT family N-acetyltransferase [Thermoguttaceae bacterium]|jgi:CelD/BcsL family acetyltransferase involved in cellulose biosynthesis